MAHQRLIAGTVSIMLIVTSIFAYGQFGQQTVQGANIGLQQAAQPQYPGVSCGPISEYFPGQDLSTGTQANTAGDTPGTVENSGRWTVQETVDQNGNPVSLTAIPATSVSPATVTSVSPLTLANLGWATSPYVSPFANTANPGGGSKGRINWITNGTGDSPIYVPNPNVPGEQYEFSISFIVGTNGGTFNLYAFSGDNDVQLSLTGPGPTLTWQSKNYGSYLYSVADFKTWWVPGRNGVAGTIANNIAGGMWTLTATVDNYPSTQMGLAVYATACSYAIQPTAHFSPSPFPSGFSPNWAYAVKFICNSGSASDAGSIGLESGLYQTDINVHNPSFGTQNEQIVKKFVLAVNESQYASTPPNNQVINANPTPYALRWAILQPDAAMRLDCGEILSVLNPHPTSPFTTAKGFVIIYSIDPIDVWVEYTVQSPSGGVSLVVLQVQPDKYTP
jgi:hypothetical protein